VRRVPADQAPAYVERLVGAYLEQRRDGERFKAFADRLSDEDLIAVASSDSASKRNGRGSALIDSDRDEPGTVAAAPASTPGGGEASSDIGAAGGEP
jgi:cytochrome c553